MNKGKKKKGNNQEAFVENTLIEKNH